MPNLAKDSKRVVESRLEQRIREAQEEFEHGRKSGLSTGWHRGFRDAVRWCNKQDASAEDIPAPENPFVGDEEMGS